MVNYKKKFEHLYTTLVLKYNIVLNVFAYLQMNFEIILLLCYWGHVLVIRVLLFEWKINLTIRVLLLKYCSKDKTVKFNTHT